MAFTYRDRALLFEDTLVVADLHLGRGASSNLEIPVGDGADVIERFDRLLDRLGPATAVVAGDFLHSFDTVPRTVEDTVAGLRATAREYGARLVVTPGNHDNMLDAVWDGPTESEFRVDDTVVLHGHEPPETDADRYVVGHDHPTIEIEGQRRPCYLVGEGAYDGADVVMVPPFNRLIRGVRVNGMDATDFRSPLVCDADAFRPVVRDEDARETLEFPPLGQFRQML